MVAALQITPKELTQIVGRERNKALQISRLHNDNKAGNVDEVWDLTGPKEQGPMPKSFYDKIQKIRNSLPIKKASRSNRDYDPAKDFGSKEEADAYLKDLYNQRTSPQQPETEQLELPIDLAQRESLMAGNPFGYSNEFIERSKALRAIIDGKGYDRETVIEAQKQYIKLQQMGDIWKRVQSDDGTMVADAANNIRPLTPWRTRPKDFFEETKELYDPITGLSINDPRWNPGNDKV